VKTGKVKRKMWHLTEVKEEEEVVVVGKEAIMVEGTSP